MGAPRGARVGARPPPHGNIFFSIYMSFSSIRSLVEPKFLPLVIHGSLFHHGRGRRRAFFSIWGPFWASLPYKIFCSSHDRHRVMGARRRGKSKPSPPPWKIQTNCFFTIFNDIGAFLLLFPHMGGFGGLFATFSYYGELFSLCGGLFATSYSMVEAFLGCPPPLRKFLRAPMACCNLIK